MQMLIRFSKIITLCGSLFLLCFTLSCGADELQDINKLFKQGKQDQALVRINSYLSSKPKDAQARFLKGLILTEQDKNSEAIKVFSELTEDFPELPEPYNNLAVLYAGQGQYDKARVALEMAIRTHPSYATAHENLGDIYAKMASQAYDRALQLDHANTSTQTKLSMIKDIFASGAAKNGKAGKTARKPQTAAASATATDAATPASMVIAAASPQKTADNASAVVGVEPVELPAKTASHKASLPNNSNDVIKRVHEWAAAWSARNVKSYLAFYADDFILPGKISRATWEAQRHDRISRQKSIQVAISNAKVKFIDENHASVNFKQSYRASHLKTSSGKTLVLVKSGGTWLIQEERTGK
jgi:tetratricopeptide (TPR) repeat protein